MKAAPLPLINGFYADETRPWSQQDICNWLPVAAESEGARTPTLAKTPPGLSPFVDTGVADPIRGVYEAEGRLFTVAGNTAYQISNAGVAIPLGSASGVGRVRFAHNQITGGNEVLFVNGSAGWVWNTAASTWTQITDTGYPGAINAVFIDGYLIQIEPARRYAFHSDLADALSYNTLDRFTSEVSPDLLVSLAVSNNELILFSEKTTEFFENTGAAQQPFRSKRISFQKGCAGRYTVATMDNTVFWLGDDGSFYLLDGYTPRRISTRPIEQAIRGLNWAQAFAYVWEDSGHTVCYWTFPDGLTFGYDASQQKWHRRASYGFNRWRLTDLAYWQSRWIGGDFQSGKLWELDWLYPWEGEQEFISEMTSPVIHDNQSRVLMPRLEVIMDTGMPEVATRDFAAQPEAPTIDGEAPDGSVDSEYAAYSYEATGGTPPYVFSITSGALPDGIGPLGSDGEIAAGTPTTEGDFTFTVRVTDATGLWDELTDTVTIAPVVIGEEWEYTGIFAAQQMNGIAWGEAVGLFVAVGNSGTIMTTPDGTTWSAASSVPAYNLRGVAFNGVDTWIASRDFNNVARVVGSPTGTWSANNTTNTDAYLVTLWTGQRFLRAGFNTSSEWSVTGATGTWNNVARPASAEARVGLVVGDDAVLIFCGNGAIHRTTNGGQTWSTSSVTSDPSPANAFTAAAFDGTTVRAYKYSGSNLYTYTSTNGGASFTAQTDVVGSSNYQAGPALFKNSRWLGLGATTTGGDQVKLWKSTNGLPTWTQATVLNYTDTTAATMVAIASSATRAVLIGNKSSSGYAMTSPESP